MKVIAFLCIMLVAGSANAQMSYMEEVKALGLISGQGLACGSTKYDDFELLARAILLTKSPSDAVQQRAIYAYSEEKANAYVSKELDGFFDCQEIIRRFDNQEIFNAVLYGDGTIKMPDGQILTPRKPYDARRIYKDFGDRKAAKSIYNAKKPEILKVDVVDANIARANR